MAWINEALATAIGSGWVYKKAYAGKDERQTWYADSTIDAFAHKIFPLVSEYLEQNRPIDLAFVVSSVKSFNP